MPFDAGVSIISQPICKTGPMSCCNFAVMRALAETLRGDSLDDYLNSRTKKCESQCGSSAKDMIKRIKHIN